MASTSPQNAIAIFRTRQGMTPAQLAKASRVPLADLRGYERGDKVIPNHHAARLSLALQVDYKALAAPQAPPAPQPVFMLAPVSDDPIQAEIDELLSDRLSIECKDRWDAADRDEFVRISAALSDAYKRLEARDAAVSGRAA